MELDGKLIGQVIYVRSEIDRDDGQRVPIMAFSPISIAPAYKRQGYGKRLLEKPFLFVPIPLAVFPVLYYLIAAIWMGNFPAAILMVIFGTAHMRAAFAAPAGEYQTDKPLSIKQKENFLKLTTLLLERVA